MSNYPKWPSIVRLHNESFAITEKIDGSNGLIYIAPSGPEAGLYLDAPVVAIAGEAAILAGSRKRWITPDQDNHGFAAWVHENAEALAASLGTGHHYGEWAGPGINGNRHGLDEKTFFLFNWRKARTPRDVGELKQVIPALPYRVTTVPVLETAIPAEQAVESALLWADALERDGSKAGPGINPEGVILRSDLTGTSWKYFCGGEAANRTSKGQAA